MPNTSNPTNVAKSNDNSSKKDTAAPKGKLDDNGIDKLIADGKIFGKNAQNELSNLLGEEGKTGTKRSLNAGEESKEEVQSIAWAGHDDPVHVLSHIPAVTRESILNQPVAERARLVDSCIVSQARRLPNSLHMSIVIGQTSRLKRIEHLKSCLIGAGMDLEELQA